MIAGETAILTAIGIVPGGIIGDLAARGFIGSFSSPEFPITAEVRPLSYVITAIVMFGVAALSLLPARRAVRRINIGEIVRERSTCGERSGPQGRFPSPVAIARCVR